MLRVTFEITLENRELGTTAEQYLLQISVTFRRYWKRFRPHLIRRKAEKARKAKGLIWLSRRRGVRSFPPQSQVHSPVVSESWFRHQKSYDSLLFNYLFLFPWCNHSTCCITWGSSARLRPKPYAILLQIYSIRACYLLVWANEMYLRTIRVC